MWLSKTQRKQLDGFHCRCLRKIAKIAHPYYSRTSNAEVLKRTDCKPLQNILLKQQLKYYIKIKQNSNPPVHQVLETCPAKRRRGRPVTAVRATYLLAVGSHAATACSMMAPYHGKTPFT